tara:strand:- start:30 stop:500 length:471 start_codon:yes stop_codon:yes gene_type:complete
MTSLEEQLYVMTKKFNMAKKGRDKFRKENEELKDKIGDLDWSLLDAETEKKKALEERKRANAVSYSQNKALKEENEKLKNNTKFFGGVDWQAYNLFAYDKWCKYYNEKISPYMEGGKASPKKYVEHLEESNKKLKKGLIEEHARAERCKDSNEYVK